MECCCEKCKSRNRINQCGSRTEIEDAVCVFSLRCVKENNHNGQHEGFYPSLDDGSAHLSHYWTVRHDSLEVQAVRSDRARLLRYLTSHALEHRMRAANMKGAARDLEFIKADECDLIHHHISTLDLDLTDCNCDESVGFWCKTHGRERMLYNMAWNEKWFVVTNGNQTDVHARVFPPNEESREVVVHANISEADAQKSVQEHNAAIAERVRDEQSAKDYEWERGQLHG